jgi:hypothetical protein
MRNTYQLGFAVVAIILVVFLLFRGSEEDRILGVLDELRVLGEIKEPEASIAQLASARQISQYFTDVTQFDLTNLGHQTYAIESREELARIILKGRATLSALELLLRDADVTIEGDRAEVKVQASALGTIKGERGQFFDVHRIRITLERVEGEWRINGGQHLFDERQNSGESNGDRPRFPGLGM